MTGIFLVAIGKFFGEIATSIGKYEVVHKNESFYAMGFLNGIWGLILLIIIGIARHSFSFSFESIPILVVRFVLEVTLTFVALHALIQAERSTFSFLRTLTIPLLIIVDLSLGYTISFTQIIGVCLIAFTIIFLFINQGLSRKGKFLSILSAVIAVITISLYKYDIAHFNSVETEQVIINSALLVTFAIIAKIKTGENVFKYFKKRIFLEQSLISGFSGVFLSFAYMFGVASVITAAMRSFEIIGALASGKTCFKERHIGVKVVALFSVVSGILLLVA